MKKITIEELKNLQKENRKIIVDFSASWCGPCKILLPTLEKISDEMTDVEVVKIDVDEQSEFISEYGIRGVPTVIIYNGEQQIDRSSGVKPPSYYTEFFK
jgi:thioredoxin 1